MGTTIPTLGQLLTYIVLLCVFATLLYYQIFAHVERQSVKASYYPLNTAAGYNLLSENEKTILTLLELVPSESPWGCAIKHALEDNDVATFRLLICSLKEQAHDNRELMKNIIGAQALEAIETV